MSDMDIQKNPNEVILEDWNKRKDRRTAAKAAAVVALALVLIVAIAAPSGFLETFAGGSSETQPVTEGVDPDSLETEAGNVSLTDDNTAEDQSENQVADSSASQMESTEEESGDASQYDLTDVIEVPDVEYPYYIKVNRQANCVTVYTLDEDGEYTVPIKAMVCSVGLNDATPLGVYTTSDKYEWRALYGDVYGQYAYRIHGSIMFHSVPYYTTNKDDLETEEYNKLGEAASLGCIRLSCADAKWLVDNCPSGTTVEIYDDEDPGPLGKPTAITIDLDSPYAGWDPTDPDPDNPWNAGSDTTEETGTEGASEEEGEEPVPESEYEPESQAVSEAEPENESQATVEPEPGSESQAESESQKQSESEKESESESQAASESEPESESQAASESESESESQAASENESESESEADTSPDSESEAESESATQDDTPQISVKSDSITITVAEENNLRACLLANLSYEDVSSYRVLLSYSDLTNAVKTRRFGTFTCTAYIKDINTGKTSKTVKFTVVYRAT